MTTESELQQKHIPAPDLMNTARCIIMILDGNGMVVNFNPYFSEISGHALKDVKGKNWVDVCIPEQYKERVVTVLEDNHSGQNTDGIVIPMLTTDGNLRTIHWSITSMFAPDGDLTGVLCCGQDITEYQSKSMTLFQARSKLSQLNLVGELGTHIAHEINQPLTALMNYLQSIKRLLRSKFGTLPESIETLVEKTLTEAERTAYLVRQIRDSLEIDKLDKTYEDMNRVIRESCDIVLPELVANHIALDFNLRQEMPSILIDKLQIQEVIINIIYNSIEALGARANSRILITSRFNNDAIIISVQDNGPGVSQDLIDNKSRTTFYLNDERPGFGLSICKSIIDAHGGQCWFSNSPSGGAMYNFSLPVKLLKHVHA